MTPGLLIKEGPRIRIRQLREDDVPRMTVRAFGGEEGARRWYAQELAKGDGASDEFRQFAVETNDGEFIGFTGFYGEPGADAGGYFAIDEPYRGRGYGTELVRCVLEVIFEDCGAARCVIDYHDWNEVAGRLYRKFGFREIQRIPIPEDKLTDEDRRYAPGRQVYAIVIAVTREEFDASRKASPGYRISNKELS